MGRTTQETDGIEEIGAVFSLRGRTSGGESLRKCSPCEKIVKATQFVERAPGMVPQHSSGNGYRQHFLVLETEKCHRIVTERLADGTATWEEDAEDLDDRISLAKVVGACEPKQDVLV